MQLHHPTTKIYYSLSENGFVTIKVFDILGKEAATLVNQKQNTGNYSVEFNGSNLSSGVYYYRLVVSEANPQESGNNFEIKKMILIK